MIEVPCVLRPKAQVRVKSEISGRIDEIHAAPGDSVEQGQLLARIDRRPLRNALERIELQEAMMVSRIRLTEIELEAAERQRDVVAQINQGAAPGLEKAGLFGREELEAVAKAAELEQSRLSLKDWQLQKRDAERNLSLADIRSPLGGTILSRFIEEGSVVGSAVSQVGGGDELFEVADIRSLKAECYVQEAESWRIQLGNPVTISPRQRRGARAAVSTEISNVSPSVEVVSGVPRLKFEAEFQPSGSLWRPGVSATARVSGGDDDTRQTVLPLTAVQEVDGSLYVYVLAGRLFRRQLISAQRTEIGWDVTAGIQPGDLVATDYSEVEPQ